MGANIKTPKNPWTKNKPQKKSHVEFPSLINFGDMWAPSWILGLFEYPKYPYLNQDTQKYLPNFSTHKIIPEESKIQTQKSPSIIPLTWNPEVPPPPTGEQKQPYTSAWAPCVKTQSFRAVFTSGFMLKDILDAQWLQDKERLKSSGSCSTINMVLPTFVPIHVLH